MDEHVACNLCRKLKKQSPKAFARLHRVGTDPEPNAHDAAIVQAAYELAAQFVEEIGAETLLKKLNKEHGFKVEISAGLTSNMKLTRGDRQLLSLCFQHAVSDLLRGHRLIVHPMGTA
jgi:hypothetical protein